MIYMTHRICPAFLIAILSLVIACEQMPGEITANISNNEFPTQAERDSAIRAALQESGLHLSNDERSAENAIQIMNFITTHTPMNGDMGGGYERDLSITFKNMILGHGYQTYSTFIEQARLIAHALRAFDYRIKLAYLSNLDSGAEQTALEIETIDAGDIALSPYFNSAFKDSSTNEYLSISDLIAGASYSIETRSVPAWDSIQTHNPTFADHLQHADYQSF